LQLRQPISHSKPVKLQHPFPDLGDAVNVIDPPFYVLAYFENAARLVDGGGSPKKLSRSYSAFSERRW
jgi:hypothetical protein